MRLNRDDGTLWLIYLRITDTQFIELFPEGEGESRAGCAPHRDQPLLPRMRRSRRHRRALRQRGIALTVEPKIALDHNRQCWIEDPDGNRIEFMQIAPNSMQVAAIARLRAAG